MLNWMKSNSGKTIVFSDEKNWTVDKHVNRRNSRYLAKRKDDVDPSVRFVAKSKFPAKAMSFGLAGMNGFVHKPIWIDGTLNSSRYIEMLDKEVIQALNEHYGVGNWVLQQDGAPCHTSKATQKYLKETLGSKGFWPKSMWPPNSPNLNPLDYHIWTRVESTACAKGHPNITALKRSVDREWSKISDPSLVSSLKSFRSRLERCIDVNGSIFEK
jgi:hypothetical protein